MGRCAVFLASYVMSSVICRDLIGFFRNSCPGGLVVFRAENEDDSVPAADIVVLGRDNPQVSRPASCIDAIQSQLKQRIFSP